MTTRPPLPPDHIAPSLLSADFSRLGEEVRRSIAAGADRLHVDVMDGHFVPNLTIGPKVVASIREHATVPLDVHLMIADPERYAEAFVKAGSDLLMFHIEAARDDPRRVLEAFRRLGVRAGVALNPDTPLDPILPVLGELDQVLVMTVFPGFAGQRFLGEAIPKVQQLRERGFARDIEVDGGIGRETIEIAARAGANVFVAGSALFGAEDLEAEIRHLRGLVARSRGVEGGGGLGGPEGAGGRPARREA